MIAERWRGVDTQLRRVNDLRAGCSHRATTGWGGKEVFVFDFGAVVFWGFPREDEAELLTIIRTFSPGGLLSDEEFEQAEDDMAFVVEQAGTDDGVGVTIANDVVSIPDDCSVKQRLAVSFAIAQSSILSIFEARIEKKIEEYKYIPETLSVAGKLNLSSKFPSRQTGSHHRRRSTCRLSAYTCRKHPGYPTLPESCAPLLQIVSRII